MGSVRNLREEAAVTAELEMVKRALQTEEQEAFSTIDQIRKMETRLSELDASLKEARASVEPRMKELVDQREETRLEIEALGVERRTFVSEMDPKELRMYDGIRAGGRRLAVAELTEDGACGHCYGVIPLQLQNEIRHGAALVRCEACGVILTAQDPAPTTGARPSDRTG
jgi:predicted  nucleic acid-binding Zn-ribbon protein